MFLGDSSVDHNKTQRYCKPIITITGNKATNHINILFEYQLKNHPQMKNNFLVYLSELEFSVFAAHSTHNFYFSAGLSIKFFIIYLSRILCLSVCVCVTIWCGTLAILLVLVIKLTKRMRRRVWRGRD